MPRTVVTPSQDVHLVSELLAQAFKDDPVMRWIQAESSRDPLIFRTLVRWTHPHGAWDVASRDGVPVGAAVWDPPGARVSALRQLAALHGFLCACRGRVRRGMILEEKFAKFRPKEPYWYLAYVGAPVQGMGVGTTLLGAGLQRVDGPAYLESSNEANIPLYERFGFEVTGEMTLPFDGPKVWPMYRRARHGGSLDSLG